MADNLNDIRAAISDLSITHLPSNSHKADSDLSFEAPWKDITEFFNEATEDFEVGQLVHLRSFSLFDAMSAIEVMDPKMDTGMAMPDTNVHDITQSLDPRQVLWVMDRLLTCEMGWLSGHSLSQTVYTCIYFHHLRTLAAEEDRGQDKYRNALKAYLLASVKCCYFIWVEMTACNVYEEEDFTTNLFGLSLYEDFSESMILNMLDVAILQLRNEENEAEARPVMNRLIARKSYLLALAYLSEAQCQRLSEAQTELKRIKELLVDSDDLSIMKTIGSGTPVDGAFDPSINRKLTSQAPPRPIILQSNEDGYNSYRQLIERLLAICNVTSYPFVGSLMTFFETFAGTRPYPDAFSRSKLNSLLFHDSRVFGIDPPVQFLLRAIDEYGAPPGWLIFSRGYKAPAYVNESALIRVQQALGEYLDRASLPFIDIFKVQCHNRSRQRRILMKLINEWDMLQEEAAVVDGMIHNLMKSEIPPYYLSNWAYHIKLDMMKKILLLGFELELYGSHEYGMISFYLMHLFHEHAQCLDAVDKRIIRQLEGEFGPPTAEGRKREMDALQHNMYIRAVNEAHQCLTSATYKMILLLQNKTHQLELLTPLFDDAETRFLHRFKPFLRLNTPAHISYQVFCDALQVEDATSDELLEDSKALYDRANRIFTLIPSMLLERSMSEICRPEYLATLDMYKRTYIANVVAIMRLKDSANAAARVRVSFNGHPWWPIFGLI